MPHAPPPAPANAASPPLLPSSTLLSHELREFSRGAFAATLNVLLTFPLNKLIARQAYEGLTARAALRTVLDDARAATLLRGVSPPLVQRGVSGGIMYASYDFWFHTLRGLGVGGASSRADGHGSGGGGDASLRAATDERGATATLKVAAAFFAGSSEWLLTPLERTQTLMQHRVHNTRFPAGRDAVRAMAAAGGVAEFYRGGSAILLRNGPANALYFSLRDALGDALPAELGGGALARDFVVGALLGAGISTLLYPLHTAKVVMQLDVGGRFAGVWETGRSIVRDRGGVVGLYRGVYLNALRSLLSWGIINAAYGATGRL